jgi:hypothetical protein
VMTWAFAAVGHLQGDLFKVLLSAGSRPQAPPKLQHEPALPGARGNRHDVAMPGDAVRDRGARRDASPRGSGRWPVEVSWLWWAAAAVGFCSWAFAALLRWPDLVASASRPLRALQGHSRSFARRCARPTRLHDGRRGTSAAGQRHRARTPEGRGRSGPARRHRARLDPAGQRPRGMATGQCDGASARVRSRCFLSSIRRPARWLMPSKRSGWPPAPSYAVSGRSRRPGI